MPIIKKIKIFVLSASISLFLPMLSLAATIVPNPAMCPGNMNDVRGIFNFFTCLLLDSLVPLLITVAIVLFIIGVIRYVLNANDSTKREEGRNFMIWGIVGLFAIVSIWGLVKLLTNTFGISFVIPQLQQ
ncbi:MAG TPA: hypothetical protein VIH31_00500 [Candidatus Paceibacterota bacterium]